MAHALAQVFLLSTLTFSNLAHAAQPATVALPALDQAHRDVIADLSKKGYFRLATCREIANAVLREQHLPALGEESRAKGRGAYDRAHANDEIPTFDDAFTVNNVTTDVQARDISDAKAKKWALGLIRHAKYQGEAQRLFTTLEFTVRTDKTPFRCESLATSFRLERDTKPKPWNAEMNRMSSLNCLNFFVLPDPEKYFGRELNPSIVKWMKKDCAMSLNYVSDPAKIGVP